MLTVSDLMTLNPLSVTPDTSLRQVINIMKSEGCRQLPILEGGKLVGIVTDRDVRLAMNSPLSVRVREANEELLDRITAQSCMTPNPITVTPHTPAYRAAEILSLYKFGALPVLDGDVLVGIITVTDFLDYFVATDPARASHKPHLVIDQDVSLAGF
jgi:acetoin utilization protein AcuB